MDPTLPLDMEVIQPTHCPECGQEIGDYTGCQCGAELSDKPKAKRVRPGKLTIAEKIRYQGMRGMVARKLGKAKTE